MLPAQCYKAIQAILLWSLFITSSPIKPMLADTTQIISYQSCSIICFASVCLGATIYSLIHRYCSSQPTIILKQSPLEEEFIKENFFKPLQTTADRTEKKLQDIMQLLAEQKNNIEELNTKLIDMQKHIDTIEKKTKIIKQNSTQLLEDSQRFAEISTFYTNNNIIIPFCLTLYLTNIRKKQKLIDEKQSQERENKTLALQQNNTKNS